MQQKTYILSIDTAGDQFALALLCYDGSMYETCFSYTEMAYRGHGDLILPTLEKALDAARITKQDMSLIVCGKGPGSFTGVRVGLSAARGLADSLHIPVVALPVPTVMLRDAQGAHMDAQRLFVWLNAHGEDVYVQSLIDGEFSAITCLTRAEAAAMLETGDVLIGDGMLEERSIVAKDVVCPSLAYPHSRRYVCPVALAQQGYEAFKLGEGANLSPLYVRPLSYQTIAEREAAAAAKASE